MTPYLCPVCNGRGNVPPGFYGGMSTSVSGGTGDRDQCHSCEGTGIVWEPMAGGQQFPLGVPLPPLKIDCGPYKPYGQTITLQPDTFLACSSPSIGSLRHTCMDRNSQTIEQPVHFDRHADFGGGWLHVPDEPIRWIVTCPACRNPENSAAHTCASRVQTIGTW